MENGNLIIEHSTYINSAVERVGDSITNVSFTLEPFKSGTILTVIETGYSNSERDVRACLGCATGWGEALTLLKFFIEHGITYGEII